jgi:hypothetical protein
MSLAFGFADVLNESFEGSTFPPFGWRTQPIEWSLTNYVSYDGDLSVYAGYEVGTWWLITPKLKPIDGANTLSFYYCDYWDYWDEDGEFTYVLVSTSLDFSNAETVWAGDSDDFTEDWQQAVIPLSDYNDMEIYIAFKHVSIFGNIRYIDLVSGVNIVINPELTLSDASWNFGVTKAGDSNCKPHVFKAINTGNVPITIAAPPQISDPGNFPLIVDNNQYPLLLDMGDEASWTVTFDPTDPCVEFTAEMNFQDDAKTPITLLHKTKDSSESLQKCNNGVPVIGLNKEQDSENQAKKVNSIALRGFSAGETYEDSFETYDDFVLDFPPWTQYDGDESETYAITNTYFPNEGYTGSFIIFNSSQTSPPITLDAWKAYSGEKMAGCLAAVYGPNYDWLIRGFQHCGYARFSFFAKSITANYGLERMRILYSYQGDDPEEDYWEYLLGDEILCVEVPADWTIYEYALDTVFQPTTVYIAIQCLSDNAFILFVDDFVFGYCDDVCPVTLSSFSATVTAQNYVQLNWVSQSESQMLGYRVYRNTSNNQAGAILTDNPMIPATNSSEVHSYSLVDMDVTIGSTYYYWLEAVDFNSSEFYGPVGVTLDGTVPPVLPEITTMGNAYPNPFKSNTNIQIDVKANETGTLSIYNIQGQLVRSYEVREGAHNLIWDSRDNAGNICSSGIYFYRLSTPSFKQTRKFMKIK